MHDGSVRWVKDAFGRDIQETDDRSEQRERSRSRDNSVVGERSDSYDSEFSDEQREESRESHHHHHSHHRRLHSSNPLDHKQRSIPHIPLANCNPRRTFQQFMRNERNEITPEAARERFTREMNTYSIDTAKRIFHAFCMEEWIQEEYVPSQVYKHRVQRQETIKQQHQKFCEFIATGDVLDNHSVSSSLTSRDYSRHIKDDIYPNCVVIDNLPSNCTNERFLNHLEGLNGIRSVYFGHPLICPAQGLYRFVWITCEDETSCKNVIDSLSNEFEYVFNPIANTTKKVRLHCQRQPPFRKHYYLPSLLNQESFIQEDFEGCLKLLHALEDYWNIDTSFEPCLKMLCDNNSTITVIDQIYLLVFFIRRVFGYDYWRNTNDVSFGISLNKFSVDMIRNQGLNPDSSEEDKEWVKNHREKLAQFLESIKEKHFSPELEGDMKVAYEHEKEQQEKMHLIYDKHLHTGVEGVVECGICGKVFEKMNFGVQHINQVHYERIENDIKRSIEEVALDLYMHDEKKTVPVIIDPRKSKYHY